MSAQNKNASFSPAVFNINDPQRYMSIQEASRLAQCRYDLSISARGLFTDLVTLRTSKKMVIASKNFLLTYTSIKSHHTLNTLLAELENVNLIRVWKTFTKSAHFNQPKASHFISFPYFEKSLPTWDDDREIWGNPPPDSDCDLGQPDEPSNGRERAKFATQESYGYKIINNSDIPAAAPTSFPHPPEPAPEPVSPPLTEERREEKPDSAVFLTNVPEPEPEAKTQKPCSPALQETNIVEEPVKPLTEDMSKDEPQVNAAILDLVTTVKREKSTVNRVKTLADDVVGLKKTFGAMPVLTGLRCMMETLPTVQNPGGWLRVHLNNPSWLHRFREKLEERRGIELAHKKNYLATKALMAAEAKLVEVEEREREEVERLLAGLSASERDSLAAEALAFLTEKHGRTSAWAVKVQVKLLVREKYLSKPLA